MRILDLFSGIGGFSLGLERAGMETVAFCEIDPYCRAVLKKHWPEVPIHEDITQLDGTQYRGTVDLICGGYPCQPFSVAGDRKGAEDDRHLWPEYYRLIREIEPGWVIGENVSGHISMGLDQVLSDLENSGYTTETFVIPACAVDAPHRRDRVWIIGYRNDKGQSTGTINAEASGLQAVGHTSSAGGRSSGPRKPEFQLGGDVLAPGGREEKTNAADRSGENVADSDSGSGEGELASSINQKKRAQPGKRQVGPCGDGFRQWPTEPDVGRVANGVPRRLDRIRALGNAVVPQIPEIIGRAIMEIER